MFGYIKPFKPDMRFCEYDTYKAVYCTLCKRLRQNYGLLSQLFLSYDFAFMAMFYMALHEQYPQFQKGRCQFNPAKKCMYCSYEGDCFDIVTAAAVLLLHYKAQDNYLDSRGISKIAARFVFGLTNPMRKKACKDYPKIDEAISLMMKRQCALEKEGCKSIDQAAHPFAQMLSGLCAEVSGVDCTRRMGYLLGRWIYLMDAADDLGDDIVKGSYNVLKEKYELSGDFDTDKLNKAHADIDSCIISTQQELRIEYERLNFYHYHDIIGNIIYEGLPKSYELVKIKAEKGRKKR